MTNKKISQLTSATTPLIGTEELPIVQDGQTVKVTTQDIADLTSNELPTQTLADSGKFLQANGSGGVSYQSAGPNYKVYSAVLSQTGTNPPTVMFLLENTIGTVTWTYEGQGQYQTNVLGAEGKIFALCGGAPSAPRIVSISSNLFGKVQLITSGTTSLSNNVLNYTSVEIRVYN